MRPGMRNWVGARYVMVVSWWLVGMMLREESVEVTAEGGVDGTRAIMRSVVVE
jgi:hypothetical protein